MTERGVGNRRLLWGALAAWGVVTLLFYREFAFAPGRLLAGSDMMLEGFPLRKFYVDEIQAGRGIPLWTPHAYAGMPFVGLLPGPIFYPSTLLYFLMPLYRAIGWTFVLHTFLGGAFAYFMARSFRLRPWSAVVCGSSFLLTGYVTSHLLGGQDGRMFAMALMPLALGLLERGLRTGDLRWFCGLSVTVAMQAFTPHTQVVYFSSLALSLYFLLHLWLRVGRTGEGDEVGWSGYVRPIAAFAGAFIVAIGVGAIQLLPTLELLSEVTRAAPEEGYAFASSYALPTQELTAFLIPDLIGSLQYYWGANPLKLHSEYLGAAPLALALLALAASFGDGMPKERRHSVWVLWGMALLAVLFALGAATPVHRIAHAVLPLIGSLRAPSLMLCVVATLVPLLAAFGWDAMLEHREARADSGESAEEGPGSAPVSWLTLGVIGVPVLILGLAAIVNPEGLQRFARLSWFEPGWIKVPVPEVAPFVRSGGAVLLFGFALSWAVGIGVAKRRLSSWTVLLVVLFTLGDAYRFADRYLPVADADTATAIADDAVLAALRERAGPGQRVWGPGTYRANRYMYDGVSSATGSQKFLLDPYARLLGSFRPDEGLFAYRDLMPFLNINYLVVPNELDVGLAPIASEPGRLLYEIPAPPWGFFPARVDGVADPDEAVARTRVNSDPLGVAVVEVEPGGTTPAAGAGTASIVRYEPDEVQVQVEAAQGGLLTVSEIHHPGWRADLDGTEVPIHRVNGAFRGVEVPTGSHLLTFRFTSPAFTIGLWLSILSSLTLLVVFVWSTRKARNEAAALGDA